MLLRYKTFVTVFSPKKVKVILGILAISVAGGEMDGLVAVTGLYPCHSNLMFLGNYWKEEEIVF